MRKLLRILVATASIVVALMSIASLWYRLNEARISGERSSGAEYSILRNALTSIQSDADLQDQVLRGRLQSLYKGSDRLMAVQVLDSGGLAVWKMPAESAYFALPGKGSSRNGFSAPEWSTVVYSTPLDGNMKLVALYATVLRSDFSYSAKLPLLVSGIWFLLACLAVFLLRKEKSPGDAGSIDTSSVSFESPPAAEPPPDTETKPETVMAEAAEITPDEQEVDREALAVSEEPPVESEPATPDSQGLRPSGDGFEESLSKLEEEIIEWSSKRQEARQPRQETRDEISESMDEEMDDDEAAETANGETDSGEETTLEDSLETLQEFEELSAEEDKADEQREQESGLRHEETPEDMAEVVPEPIIIPSPPSPRKAQEPASAAALNDLTDLPMPLSLTEPGIESRLSQELSRSDRSEVSLMLIHCSIGGPTDPAAMALSATMKDYIGSKELIFELYKGAFAVILPSVDLGGALKMSEDLSDVLATTLGLYRDIDGEAPVYIGISARSERPVDAYKLYREASTAVHKAFSGSHSRILAFRPKMA